jgi:hypothetical protein
MVFKHYQKVSEVLRVILAGFLEPFIYHPLILFFAIKGYFNFYLGRELQWGTMTRRGVNTN